MVCRWSCSGGVATVARALGPKQTGYLMWFVPEPTQSPGSLNDVMDFLWQLLSRRQCKHVGADNAAVRGTVLGYGAVVGILAGLIFDGFLGFPSSFLWFRRTGLAVPDQP